MNIINKIKENKILSDLIKGKRVCFCGPAASNIGKNYGEYIDSFDTVCRINLHTTGKYGWDNNLNKDFGSRTDVMFTGIGILFECFYNDFKNRYESKSSFNCFRDTKFLYLTDPINNEEFTNTISDDFSNLRKIVSDKSNYEKKIKELNIDYDIINLWIQRVNFEYIKEKYNIINYNTKAYTNSGVHAIQILLRHEPKELFITGMNFGDFGKGNQFANLYIKGTNERLIKNQSKNSTIHTFPESLKFFKEIIKNNKNIKLDKLLKNFFKNIEIN